LTPATLRKTITATVSHRALYYPWTHIQDPRFLFESLLYWDRWACIVPHPLFEPSPRRPADLEFGAVVAEAHERFATNIVPSDDVKDVVHERIAALLDVPAPEWCRPEALPIESWPIFITKLHFKTIDLLTNHGWARPDTGEWEGERIVLNHAASCVVMSELVNAITTETLPTITEEPETFRGNCNALLWRVGAQRALDEGDGEAADVGEEADTSFLVSTFLRLTCDASTPLRPEDLSKLITLREDSGFNEMRERFCDHVDQFVADMGATASEAERQVIADEWKQRLAMDRRDLVKDLRAARIESVTEKDGLIATVAGVAASGGAVVALGPIGVVIGVGLATVGLARQHRRRREEAMDEHWSSFLFAAESPRLRLL
jgi:hypothetical protein